ncbi:MAG: CapA family protein [Bacillota bacterium]|nr:CapA family protein [Bacillota bacterium]
MRRKRKKSFKIERLIIAIMLLACFILLVTWSMHYTTTAKANKIKSTVTKSNVKADKLQKNKKVEEIPKEEKSEVEEKTPTEIVISSVGDCTLGNDSKFAFKNSMPDVLAKNNKDYSYFFKNVADIFKADDITTANCETTFTDATKRADKQYTFKAPAAYAKAFSLGGIEAVNISNNHIYDYLQKGFQDTISALKQENVNFFGEGNQWVTDVKGVKVGYLGYMGFSYDNNFLNKLQNDIRAMKEKSQFVVINFHWGVENAYYPNSTQKYLAHYAIDQGADLIVGHHPHVIEGLERYNGKIIAYSMGNFCFGGNTNPSDKDTFILQLKLSFVDNQLKGYAVKVIPCSISSVNYINDYSPIVLSGENKQKVFDKLNKLSTNLAFSLNDEFNTLEKN